MRFTEEDLIKNDGKFVFGRVAEYSQKKGFGHIYTEDRKDIFLSSYALGKLEKRIAIGSTLKFIPKKINDKICATEVEVVDLFPSGRTFRLPNKQQIYIRNVQKFGIVSGPRALKDLGVTEEDMKKENRKIEDYEYLYIIVKNEELRYFKKGAPFEGQGQIDIIKYFRNLCNKFIYLN